MLLRLQMMQKEPESFQMDELWLDDGAINVCDQRREYSHHEYTRNLVGLGVRH